MIELRQKLNLSSEDNTFENFRAVEGSERALRLFKELVDSPGWFMLLCGGTAGNGKTHLCDALSIELYKKGIYCRVNDWSEVIRGLWAAIRSNKKDAYDELFRNFQRSPYLILDDVDIHDKSKDFEWNELEDIIKYREKHGLMTVMTTNIPLNELPVRVVSRFSDAVKSRKVKNEAPDYRPLKGKTDV
jgi:DNA replication protein DnaC